MTLVTQKLLNKSSWIVPGVAFVDPLATGTGVLGDGNKPFSTVALAEASGPNAIYLLPGNYTEQINLVSGRTYFSYPGVTFISGGLRAIVNQDGTRWLGYSSFIGNFFQIYLNSDVALENMLFEVDQVEETGSGARCIYLDPHANNSNIVFRVRKKVISVGGNGHGIRFQRNANVELYVDEGIEGSYGPLNTFNLSGTCNVHTPYIKCTNLGFAGNVAGFKAAVWNQSSSGGELNVYADVIQETTGVSGGITSGVYSDGTGDVNIYGRVFGGALRGVVNSSTGKLLVKGGVQSTGVGAFTCTSGQTYFESTTIVQNTTSTLSGTAEVWIASSQINSSATDHVVDVTNNANSLFIHNTPCEGNSGLFVEHNATTATIGFDNASCNLANSALTDAYTPSGFTQRTGISTPNFI